MCGCSRECVSVHARRHERGCLYLNDVQSLCVCVQARSLSAEFVYECMCICACMDVHVCMCINVAYRCGFVCMFDV